MGREVDGAAEGVVDGQRMEAGALIVEKSGERCLRRSGTPARLRSGLEHGDLDAAAGKGESGGESVRTAADDDRGRHCGPSFTARPPSLRST
ncbi:hypothetical protein JOE56_001203 [Brevibacterium paucivorans]|uniref:Uncharacterized protein n=1 Tax=Brevibacterium paucivorans TaxID=170994 RepID=A0ABS2SLM4_9MICO|nr:hypothetical protein [Brevibacterium paucivorans]